MWSRGPLKDLKDSKLILNESTLFPLLSRISFVPFRTFRGPLFPKLVIGQELFFPVSYNKPALACNIEFYKLDFSPGLNFTFLNFYIAIYLIDMHINKKKNSSFSIDFNPLYRTLTLSLSLVDNYECKQIIGGSK